MSAENEAIDPPADEEVAELRTVITIMYLKKRRGYCYVMQVPGQDPFRSKVFKTYGDAARSIIKLLK